MFGGVLLAWWLAGSSTAPAPAPDATTMALLRPVEYENVTISPDGMYLAIAHRQGEGTTVEVIRRSDGQLATRFVPSSRGLIAGMSWLGPDKLLVSASRTVGPYPMPLAQPTMYIVTIGDKHSVALPRYVAGTIDGDDEHLIVRRCKSWKMDPCRLDVRVVPLGHVSGNGEFISDVPARNADLTFDHAGQPRFALSVADDAAQQFYVRPKDTWLLLNDSNQSGVFVNAMGVSRDNRFGYLIRENRQGTNSIVRYEFATGMQTELLRDPAGDPLTAVFSLDGKEPVGAVFGPGRPVERYWDENSDEARWRRALSAAFPDDLTTVVSATSDGELAVVKVSSDRDPGKFYLFDRSHAKATLLYNSASWIDPDAQRASQAITLTARDGLTLHGFVTLPHTAEGVLPPMVVVVHGGPFYARADWSFDPVAQLLAQHGYAVLRINFRGSSGSGRAFVDAGMRQWGATMQDDVTDATRWAIAQHMADPGRICIFGASYGAYSALMGVAREPSLYRCAIGLSGVYDLNRLYRWGDTHRTDLGINYLRLMVGNDPAALARVSPLALAGQITAPVLLGHGADDGRAPILHATAMRDALTAAGHPTELITYDYEAHGLASYGDNLDFYTRMLRFLDAHTGVSGSPPK